MDKDLITQEAADKFRALVEEVNICMFISDPELGQTCRPMATVKVDGDINLWFFTDKYSSKVQDIRHNNAVHLVYAHPGKNSYLDVWGKAVISEDRALISELWNPLYKAWFSEGEKDPRICLLKVTPERAHYWDANGNKIASFFKMLQGALTGNGASVGESGDLKI